MANGTNADVLLPIELKYGPDGEKIDQIIDASLQESTIVVAREDGKVWTIGRNDYGQMGDGSIKSKTEFVCISKPRIKFEQSPVRINGIGKTKQLEVSMSQGFNLLYNTVENSDFTYESRNKNIVTVDETGKITSVKKGKTQIKVTETNTEQTSSVDVYVLGDEDITFPQIESSNYATLTLKSNGEVWGYGYNGYGQLGTGDTNQKILPTYAGINNIMQIALGNNHAIAVDKDGYVWTWGYNNYGQLGNGETGGVSLEKVKVKSSDGEGYLENIVAVAAGDSFSIALDKDGNVYGWGYNGYGVLGQGDTNLRKLPTKIEGLEGIIKIEAANQSVFAIDSKNNLWAAGYNGYGNLGDGTTERRTTYVQITALEDVADVSASPINSTIVLLLDGSVWGFGNNGYNALTNVGGSVPQPLQGPDGLLENVTSIATGYYTGYAITADEKVVAWGLNDYTQLTEHNTNQITVPVYMKDKDGNDLTDVMIVSGGISNTEIAKNDGKVWSIGYNGYGELGDGSRTSKNELVCISTQYIKLQERQVTLKLSDPEYQINPQTVYGFNLLYDVAENNGFTYESLDSKIAAVDENTGLVTAKSLGRTYVTLKAKDTEDEARVVIDVIGEDKQTVEKVEAGHIHSLALKQDGTIWSWGDNSQGELGNGEINSIKTTEPTQIEKGIYTEVREEITEEGSTQITTTQIEVEMNNIKDIAAGYYYNLAVDADGYVYSWGYNGYGQLGDGTTTAKAIPTRMEGLENIEKVYAYGNTSAVINENGEVYVWGYGYEKTPTKLNFYIKAVDIHGRLILAEDGGVWTLSSSPNKISGLSNIVEVASGDNYYAALDTKGKVWVWGYNGYGQLSQGYTSYNITEPTTVKIQNEETEELEELTNIVELKAGNNNLLMITQDGSLYTSGYSGYGQLGIGEYNSYITIATKAINMENTKLVDSDTYHSIASDQSGFVYTTGYNAQGQLGDGAIYDRRNEFVVIGDTYVYVEANKVAIEEGDSKQIKASLNNKFNLIHDVVDSQNMKYESLNTEIATVDQDGTIHGIAMGAVEIVVTHTITNKTATIFVQVVPESKVTVPKVETSDTHTVALKADGTVWTWGNNSNGQLGIGDNVQKTSPIQVREIEAARDVSAGYYYTAVVAQDGKVWTFGHNGYGQLGDGTGSDRLQPVQVIKADGAPLENIVKISAGKYRTVALDEDGKVWIWGYGYGSTATKLATLENIIDISSNYAVNQAGEVYTINNATKLEVSNIIRVSEGTDHALFLTRNGKGYSVGTNTKGQLGNGTRDYASTPTLIQNSTGIQSMTDIKELKAGNQTSIAIMKNGDVYTWGSNDNYKLGNIEDSYTVLPKINEKTNKAISGFMGPNNAGIIDEEGFVYTWGLGDYGNLGNKLFNTVSDPVLVGQEEVGLNEYDIVIHKGETHQVLVTNKTFNVLKEIEDKSEKTYNIGNSSIATIDSTGLVTGQKEGKTTIIVTKKETGATSIANVTVLPDDVTIEPMALTCMSHTVVLKANGTVWSYGVGSSYELGNGTTSSSDRPVQVAFPEGVVIKQIAVGNTHNLALDTDGNVWGWGVNSNYALGTTASTPVKLGLSGIKKIAANNDQSMALTEDGYVYVWGQNANGELGTGTYQNVTSPKLLNYINGILDIAMGKNHTLLLTTEGKVLTSGLNVYGQTAKEQGKSNQFEQIEVPVTIGKIAAGDNHSVLLSVDGDVYTFGYNSNGQLGTGRKDNETIPTKINATNIMQISAGKNQTIVLGADRKLYATGSNSNGQLGIGTDDAEKLQLTEITAVNDMMLISSGNTYNVAIKYDGDVYGWGDYYHGTQSIKTKTNSRIPVKIGNDSSYVEEPEITVNVEGTRQINVTPKYSFNVFKDEEEDVDFTYESIENEIATVDENGLVTGVKIGTTWVRVTENDTLEQKIVIVRVIGKDSKYAPQVAGGDSYASVLKADGSIWGFGYNSDGQLGNDTLAPINVPSQTNILATYRYVTTGEKFTVALRDDGTVWAWGDNTYGQLGQGNRVSAKKPVQVPGLTNIVAVAAGDNHVIALDNLGNVYTWGLNSSGQLGNGKTTTVTSPEKINSIGEQIISVSAGGNLTAMVDTTGAVYVFGDNSSEQIEEFKYNYDQYGQIILPATNLYIAEPQKIATISNAVKVDCLDDGIVIMKEDGSVVRTVKYAMQEDAEITTIALRNMVDISATNESVMLLDKDGNIYTYGDNSKGQAGIGTTSNSVELQLITEPEDKTYFAMGTGYKNNYIIDTEGFVWGAGDNEYGQLGNGLYESSYTFTLTGDRKFEIVPDARIMKQPEEEKVTIKSNIFNVFSNVERALTDYEWTSSNSEVVSVENGVLVSQDMGEATITATDKVTGETATALRVVVPLDEDRISSITVNDVDAKVSGERKYEVSVVPNIDGTGTLKITTKDATDQISIDGGSTYVTAEFAQDIDLDTNPKEVKITVKATNGRTVNYFLTINVLSNDAGLEQLGLKIGENEISKATSIGSKEYKLIIPNDNMKPEIYAKTMSSKAKVSVNAGVAELGETTRTVDMISVNKKTIPVVVTAESGDQVTYYLTIYKEDALTELDYVKVDGEEATKLNDTIYKIIIPKDKESVEINAKTLYADSKIEIGTLGEDTSETTKTISTVKDETIVNIYVRNGEKEKQFTLYIVKEGTEDILGLFSVTVGGVEITPVGKIYEAYVGDNTKEIEVKAITISDLDKVTIGENETKVHESTVTLSTEEEVNTYTITVTDPEDETNEKEYTLVIKKTSADNSLKFIIVGNSEFSKEAKRVKGTNTYSVSVSDKYSKADVIATANYELSQVSVNNEEYEKHISTREVTIEEEPTKVDIVVKALNEETQNYTLEIYREDSNNNLFKVTVDGDGADPTNIAENTYEYTLSENVDKLDIGAITQSEKATVKINTNEAELHSTTREVDMIGRAITVNIEITAEDGTSKNYQLIVHAVPDNVKLSMVKVDGKEADEVPVNSYEARVHKDKTSFELYIVPEDPKARIQVNGGEIVTGSVSLTVGKDSEEEIVNIRVIAQDETTQDYTLIVTNQSDDAELAILKVDGEILEAGEDGIYRVDKAFLTEEVTVQAIANNNHASVSINGTTPTEEEQTSQVTLPDQENEITIKVIAEDGTYKEYTLMVTRLPNEIAVDIYVVKEQDGVEILEKIDIDEETNKGIAKIGTEEIVTLRAITKDELAEVSINGSMYETGKTTQDIPVVEETTTVPVQVKAQDETIESYEITLQRASTNNELLKLETQGLTEYDILKTGDDTYTIKMPDTWTELTLTATAKDEFATVKIDDGYYGETYVETKTVTVDEQTKEISIWVKAESGAEKLYKVTIEKVTDLGLEYVYIEGDKCITEEGNYVAFIDADTEEIGYSIKPNNPIALISTKIGTEDYSEMVAAEVHTGTIAISSAETVLLIKAQDPNDETRFKEYTVTIRYKSADADLETLLVDEKTTIKMEDSYYATTTMDATKAEIYVKANNKYASIIIGTGEAKQGENTQEIELESGKTTEVLITITSQDEKTTNTYKVIIERKSDDTGVTILFNKESADEIEEETLTYTKYIDRDVTNVSLEITANSDIAEIEIAGERATFQITKDIEIVGETTQMDVIVTAENEDTATYHINIVKKSTDNTISTVKVNGEVITENEEGKYVATVIDKRLESQDTIIEVVTNNANAKAQIGDGSEWQIQTTTSTRTFKDGNRTITLNINVQAQDSATAVLTKELTINLVSDDIAIKVVKNGDEVVKYYDAENYTFREFLDRDIEEVSLTIEANNAYTTLTSGETTGTGIISLNNINVKDQEEATIKFTAVAETGRTQDYTIILARKSNNANASYIYVDGVDILGTFENIDSVPTSIISIGKTKNNALIEVLAENEYANIKIGDTDVKEGHSKENIALDTGVNTITVPIVITSQDGTVTKTYNIMFVRLSDDTKIQWLEVNGKHVIEDEDGNYEVTVKASETKAEVKIILSSILAKVTMGGEEAQGTLEETILLPETGDTVRTITITAMDGTVRTCTLTIHKQENDLGLEKVYLNNRRANRIDETTFEIDVQKGTAIADIKAVATKSSEYVQINSNTKTQGENTYDDCSLSGKVIPIKVIAMFDDEVDQEKEYTLIIEEVEEPDVVEDLKVTIKIDDEIIKQDTDGNYVKIVESTTDNVTLWAGVTSETSKVKIIDQNGESEYQNPSSERNISLQEGATEVQVTVQNGALEEKTYNVYILKDTEDIKNAGLNEIIAGTGAVTEGTLSPELDGTYTTFIKKDATTIELTATSTYPYAKVSIDGNRDERGSSTRTIEMGDADEKQIVVAITSADGTIINQYIVNIYREPQELELKTVYVDNRKATKVDDTNFTIDIVKATVEVDLKAILYSTTEYVSIAGNEATLGENELENYQIANGKIITIIASNGLDNTAEDYKEKQYTLTLTEVEDIKELSDLQLAIKVDGEEIAKEEDGIYIAMVDQDAEEAIVEAISTSIITKVKIGDTEFRVQSSKETIALAENITKVIITAKNGAGDQVEYKLYIVKENTEETADASLKELKANENVAKPGDDNKYPTEIEIEVTASEEKVILKATATQELAMVSVAGNTATRGSNTNTIDMTDETEKEITITVTAIDGTSNEYTVKIHRLSAITGKVITQAADQANQSATIIVYNSEDTRDEDDLEDPRKIIKEIAIEKDGSFELDLPSGEYDIVIKKTSYLEYRLTNIVTVDGETVELEDIEIYAGDIVKTGEIEVDDLVALNDKYGTEVSYEIGVNDENVKYDLNEDGRVDKLDRNILKRNYGKLEETSQWVNPNAISVMSLRRSTQDFIVPMACEYTITSEYGYRVHPTTGEYKKHTGIDLAGDHHTEIFAVADGEVTFSGVQNGFGNCVEIKHVVNGETIYSFYAHLSRIDVQAGDKVVQGQTIGLEGGDPETDPNPGSSTGHHLHFEIRNSSGYGNDVDPTLYINF